MFDSDNSPFLCWRVSACNCAALDISGFLDFATPCGSSRCELDMYAAGRLCPATTATLNIRDAFLTVIPGGTLTGYGQA